MTKKTMFWFWGSEGACEMWRFCSCLQSAFIGWRPYFLAIWTWQCYIWTHVLEFLLFSLSLFLAIWKGDLFLYLKSLEDRFLFLLRFSFRLVVVNGCRLMVLFWSNFLDFKLFGRLGFMIFYVQVTIIQCVQWQWCHYILLDKSRPTMQRTSSTTSL